MNLRNTIEQQALQFAQGIIAALRNASLDELMTISGADRAVVRSNGAAVAQRTPARGRGRLGRRSPQDIARTLDQIVGLLAKNPKGLRAEQIKSELGLDTREVPRPLQDGLASGVLSKVGNKRATTYFTGGGKKQPPFSRARKTTKRK